MKRQTVAWTLQCSGEFDYDEATVAAWSTRTQQLRALEGRADTKAVLAMMRANEHFRGLMYGLYAQSAGELPSAASIAPWNPEKG